MYYMYTYLLSLVPLQKTLDLDLPPLHNPVEFHIRIYQNLLVFTITCARTFYQRRECNPLARDA